MDDQLSNVTRDSFPLHGFDMNSFFANWTIEDNDTTASFANLTTEIPSLSSVQANVDENAIIVEQDLYPHTNYDDYPYTDDDNYTLVDYYEPSTPPSPESSTLDEEYLTVRGIAFDDDRGNGVPTTPLTDACEDVERVIRCYERICENKTLVLDNVSGTLNRS